jgi:SHAQKYF class myb-like DNA-binding protein
MVFTSRVQSTLFASGSTESTKIVRLPMSVVPQYETRCKTTGEIIPTPFKPIYRSNLWSTDEHERFLRGLELFPNGPWKEVAQYVGSKTTRQTMTHAQKYRQKIERRLRANGDAYKSSPLQPSSKISPPVPLRDVLYGSFHESTTPTFGSTSGVTPTACDDDMFSSVSSPSDQSTTVFDTDFFDQEFETLLASLDSLALEVAELGELVAW